MVGALKLPVLDLATSTEAELADQFRAAATETGFLQLSNHGVAPELLARAFKAAEAFFALPLDQKLDLAMDKVPNTIRGYATIGSQVLEGSLGTEHEGAHLVDQDKVARQVADAKEGLFFGVDTPESSKHYGRYGHGVNLFPPESALPGLRELAEEYITELWKLQQRVARIVALSLGQDPDVGFMADATKDAIVLVRLIHYPATQEKDVTGIGAHSDFGFTTLLATSGEPGLELYHGGQWHAIEPREGTFILNIGDVLSRMTGGRYKSSLHRVMNTSGKARFSIPCFFEGNPDFVVRPLDTPEDVNVPFSTINELLEDRNETTYAAALAEPVDSGREQP